MRMLERPANHSRRKRLAHDARKAHRLVLLNAAALDIARHRINGQRPPLLVLAQTLQDLDPVRAQHYDVKQHARRRPLQRLQIARQVRAVVQAGDHATAQLRYDAAGDAADHRLVVHDDDGIGVHVHRHWHLSCGRSRFVVLGLNTTNVCFGFRCRTAVLDGHGNIGGSPVLVTAYRRRCRRDFYLCAPIRRASRARRRARGAGMHLGTKHGVVSVPFVYVSSC
mmetsp:Transcript_21227/g.74873  ORF Transcript_21227/g.74873 Transcript_21227/m.74873 type:complete len:224 (+) Transcript_21227:200-871(+)